MNDASPISLSCSSLEANLAEAIANNIGIISTLLMIFVGITIILAVLWKINPSNRRWKLLLDDMFRNMVISFLLFLLSYGFLYFMCIALQESTSYGDIGDFLRQGDIVMLNLENKMASMIRDYRERAINTYGPNSIKFFSVPSLVSGGVVIFPKPDSPKNKIYLRTANDAIGALNYLILSIAVQRMILGFLTSTELFYIILIISLMIRVIPFLREAGDFMFVFTIALFVVLPILYTIFTLPLGENGEDFALSMCVSISSDTKFTGMSFNFLKPLDCESLAFINIFQVYAVFLPNIIYGLTFSFASNFRRVFDMFQWS